MGIKKTVKMGVTAAECLTYWIYDFIVIVAFSLFGDIIIRYLFKYIFILNINHHFIFIDENVFMNKKKE